MPTTKRLPATLLIISILVLLFPAPPALAADRYWVGGSGDWSDPANWSATAGGPGGAGVPGVKDKVLLLQSDAANRLVTYSAAGPAPALGDLNLDATGSGNMTLSITGGELLPNVMKVGSDGRAAVTQSGGTIGPKFSLYVGWDGGSSGTYDLQSGELTTSSTLIGDPWGGGSGGSFLQSGGTHTTDSLNLEGQYHLEGTGVLTPESVNISGTFSQTGGSHTAQMMTIKRQGRYEWTGGSLAISYGWVIGSPGQPPAQFIFPSSPSSLSVNGIVDFGARTLTNAGNASVTLGPESLLIHDAGDNPAAGFGSFTNQGMTHVRGTTLTIPAGKTVGGTGSISDPVDVWGTIDADGSMITLSNTVTIHPDAYLNGVILRPTSEPSVMYGGRMDHGGIDSFTTLRTAGRFVQYDGVIEHGFVRIMGYEGKETVYEMHGGTLSTGIFWLGDGSPFGAGPARFEQTGGDVIHEGNTAYPIYIRSATASAPSTYVMSGGTLHAMNGLAAGTVSGNGREVLQITDPSVGITIGRYFALGKTAEFEAVSGTSIHLDDAYFDVQGADPLKVAGLENLTLIFAGDPAEAKSLEVAGLDLGAVLAGYDANFALDTLQIGSDDGFGWAKLVDVYNNSLANGLPEALYVEHLVLGAGSILDLNGRNLYYQTFTDLGGTVNLNGGQLVLVPEPTAIVGLAWLCLLLGRRR
ncbi:MAG: hypothetical protein IT443_07390 [Phycisphaeraceae bacterium]|nr:hypothetical protein [Phycisphaeraceae bacterium]